MRPTILLGNPRGRGHWSRYGVAMDSHADAHLRSQHGAAGSVPHLRGSSTTLSGRSQHTEVVPCHWRLGGPMTLASDTGGPLSATPEFLLVTVDTG